MATKKQIIEASAELTAVVAEAVEPIIESTVEPIVTFVTEQCFDVIVKTAFKHVINNQEIVGNVGDAATLTATQLMRLKEFVDVNR
jgi:hypothetical protein